MWCFAKFRTDVVPAVHQAAKNKAKQEREGTKNPSLFFWTHTVVPLHLRNRKKDARKPP